MYRLMTVPNHMLKGDIQANPSGTLPNPGPGAGYAQKPVPGETMLGGIVNANGQLEKSGLEKPTPLDSDPCGVVQRMICYLPVSCARECAHATSNCLASCSLKKT